MKVKLSYYDNQSLTIDEIVKQARLDYGPSVAIEVLPESNIPNDILYFALQQIVTHEQLSLLYSGDSYQQDIKKLRSEILFRVEEVLNDVIIDNEARGT